jgi:hypothetical protein
MATGKKTIPVLVEYIYHLKYIKKKQQIHFSIWGHVVAHLVEALRYKPEGRGFDSRWCHWNFSWHIIFQATLWPCGRISL